MNRDQSHLAGPAPLGGTDSWRVRTLAVSAPWHWLAAGWRDIGAAPGLSFSYGTMVCATAGAILSCLISTGWGSLALVLGAGFLLVGPFIVVGLYEASRQLEHGKIPSIADVLYASLNAPGQLCIIGAILSLIYCVWMQLVYVLLMYVLGSGELPPESELEVSLRLTPKLCLLLAAAAIASAFIAASIVVVSALAISLLLDRSIDAVTAIGASFDAVRHNPKTMALWTGLVAVLLLFGVLTLCLGFVFAFPLIGHASWHAFRDITGQQLDPMRDAT